jgi:hypothetical protein
MRNPAVISSDRTRDEALSASFLVDTLSRRFWLPCCRKPDDALHVRTIEL